MVSITDKDPAVVSNITAFEKGVSNNAIDLNNKLL